MAEAVWPALPYEEWRETRDTLHMYMQVVGKLRLSLSPFEPQWANVPLYLTARGLTSSTMPVALRTLDAEFDFFDHVLLLRTSDGGVERIPLGGAVADFYAGTMSALQRLKVDVAISTLPSEVPDPIPFPEDRTHATYIAADAARFFHVLSMIDVIFKQHRAAFNGRTTLVQFFWGTFDLALTRFSGRPGPPAPPDAGVIYRFGAGAEEICGGWWPGDERVPYPAFYAYALPKPEDLDHSRIEPDGAKWSERAGEFLFPYEKARSAPDPQAAVLDFLRSTYRTAASKMGWPDELTNVPTPEQHTR